VKKIICLLLGLGFLAGCGTVTIEQGSSPAIQPQMDQAGETQILRALIPVGIRGLGTTERTLVAGMLTDEDYLVTDSAPFITVSLNPGYSLFDTFGNYHVYEGTCAVSIRRMDGKILGSEVLSVKGERSLDKTRALLSTKRKAAAAAADYVLEQCRLGTTGVESVILSFTDFAERRAHGAATRLRKKDGIFSCDRIREVGNTIQYRLIYSADIYPDGMRREVDRAVRFY